MKGIQEFYTENFKVLREIKESLNKWRVAMFRGWKTQYF